MSISSQLQAIKSVLNVSADSEPGKRRPLTRPSILFDAKAAADIDVETILNIALAGLEVLISVEDRFRNYKDELFSQQSKELDRELVGQEENRKIDLSIGQYLRLLSGYLELNSALKTLEYLIRRYKVHVYNTEDLIFCSLPYHDTHTFVQIVQLINTGNSRWKFLDGVKASGARLPREVIVQQCIRDMGVLEAICNYATPVKKVQPSKPVIGFCTAVVFEVLGHVTVDTGIVKRILPYISFELQPGSRRHNQKAGALMIVSLLAQKATLAPNVVKSLLHSVAIIAREESKDRGDLQWLRMSLMTIMTIVQFQDVNLIPKKTLDVLNEIRDFSVILSQLNKDFNIDRLFAVFLDSLIEYSGFDELCNQTLLAIIETVPMKEYVNRIVSRLLTMRMKISQDKKNLVSSESGSQGKQILLSISEKYPNESRKAFYGFMKDAKLQSNKVSSSYDALCKILDENMDPSPEIPDPKLFFLLDNSEAKVRRLAILGLDADNILREKAAGSKKFDAIQDALVHRLYDEDLNVVLAVLNLKNMPEILCSPRLVEALGHVLHRCTNALISSSSTDTPLSDNVALLCLQQVVTHFKEKEQYELAISTAVFPLLLVRPKTQRVNLKALELAEESKFPMFKNLVLFPISKKKLDLGRISSINFEIINKLVEEYSLGPEGYMPWFAECCNSHELSKTLFFLVLLQSLKTLKMDDSQFSAIFYSCFPILKNEWGVLESFGISSELCKKRIFDGDCKGILEDLLDNDIKDVNAAILACLLLRLSELFITVIEDVSVDMKGKWALVLQDLFLFFVCHSKDVFRKHLEWLYAKCKISIAQIMLKQLIDEGSPYAAQIESLHSLPYVCSQLDESSAVQLLSDFPSILVPLSSDSQNVRVAAMSCIEELFPLWSRIGNNGIWLRFLGDLLSIVIQQKKMIVSDINVLASLFTSLFSSSDSLLVQQAIGKRFDASTKDEILNFLVNHALELPAHAKLSILSLVKGAGSKLISISGVRSLLANLLETHHQLSQIELDILCLLLECCTKPISSHSAPDLGDFILKALQEDSTIVKPCLTTLKNLTSSFYGAMNSETQELVFRNLLVLFRSANGDVQNAARDTLLRINLDCSMLEMVLDSILDHGSSAAVSSHGKKRKKTVKCRDLDKEKSLRLLSSYLDVLFMKKNIVNRVILVGPLFKLLHQIVTNNEWMIKAADHDKARLASFDSSQNGSDTSFYIQQTLLSTLEDICAAIKKDTQLKDVVQKIDLPLLVSCTRSSSDAVTRNLTFSLITTLVKVIPDKVLDHVLDILTAMGEATVTQWDSYSQNVFEGLISAIIPCWLSRTNNTDQLLQIFVNVFPQIAEHRRLSVIKHILRTLGEAESLGSLFFLLIGTLVSRKSLNNLSVHEQTFDHLTDVINKQWEYEFAVQLSEQYSCTVWLPSLILALQKIGGNAFGEDTFMQILIAMQFIADKLRDPEISYQLEMDENSSCVQTIIGELMEQVVYHLQLVDSKKKHFGIPASVKSELKEHIRDVLKTFTKNLQPSTYFKVILILIGHDDRNVRKKSLRLLCETVKDFGTNPKVEKKGFVSNLRSLWLHLGGDSLQAFENLCLEILKLLDDTDDISRNSLKLAAVSALEVLANKFPSHDRIYDMCLGSICQKICSDNSALSRHCLRATGALINALGPRALQALPTVMECVLRKSDDASSQAAETNKAIKSVSSSNAGESLFMSILLTLEAVVDKLARFLTPYLGDILRLVVLHPLSLSPSDPKLKSKADIVRKLITEKIPIRLLLPAVLSMYSDAVKSGKSISIVFEMLRSLVGIMDRSSIGVYHAKIFDLCLQALDLRYQTSASIQNIDEVEQHVVNAVVTLTMRLTETMFRPLFIKTVEWSSMSVNGLDNTPGKANSRAISFYGLVNKLAETHRSLFVPYFKYLLDGCVRGLVDAESTKTDLTRKKKKAKLIGDSKDKEGALPIEVWHLRALILSSLHKCFLYDTGSGKFLNSSTFEVLLKPIVSQLAMDPPASIVNDPNLPSVEEVDDLLVACVSQMAVVAGSDLLWKPLNHEVLMQTRSEKIRPRILGLRIIKSLLEKLKEEYLIFLPETIPFLAEWLEDMEPSVKLMAQEVRQEMETLSGESLGEYL